MADNGGSGGSKTAVADVPPVTVRHYCQGIGDSHLLRFRKPDGGDFWMLIDCGVHSSVTGGTAKIAEIVADIAAVTGGHIDVLVVTHEHWDHVSGFLTAAEAFKQFSVCEVWMGWTENPADAQAQALDKFKAEALAALALTSQRLNGAAQESYLGAVADGLDALLGFNFGAQGEKVRSAREAAKALAPGKVQYFDPKKTDPLTIPGLPDLRIYVLGPPRDPDLLKLTDRAGEMYGMRAPALWPAARTLARAFGIGDEGDATSADSTPFDPSIGRDLAMLSGTAPGKKDPIYDFARKHYFGPATDARDGRGRGKAPDPEATDQSWRRIDHDWLGIAADLAMQLDDRTNNTSLALAFEFVASRRVLLFAGDAQIGNWLSWQDLTWTVDGQPVTGPDLLARTVYYKVGHHGSQNATPMGKGLEMMTSPDLAAFIPTNAADALKVHWGRMPLDQIVTALDAHASERVVRADDPWVADPAGKPAFEVPSGVVKGLRHGPGLWVEFDLA